MPIYSRGCVGVEVSRIQTELQAARYYTGAIDGFFGGGTEMAVRTFQRDHQLGVDGKVGPDTWSALFGTPIIAPSLLNEPLDYRCLALTGAFETNQPPPACFAGLSGDFDGQGISLGVCQWNFGQSSLQPLLSDMLHQYPLVSAEVFGGQLDELGQVLSKGRADQLAWARSIQSPRGRLFEPWAGYFQALGRTREFQQIEQEYTAALYRQAKDLCAVYGLRSGRGVALMFDIKVQNGNISAAVHKLIQSDIAQLPASNDPAAMEVARMRIIANRRADAAKVKWRDDVRARKLTIANGAGQVHGNRYDLAEQFGITLDAAVGAAG